MQFSYARIVYEHGRGDRIRTCDILLPKQARYQAAPLPDALKKYTALSSGESCEFAPLALCESCELALADLEDGATQLVRRHVVRLGGNGLSVDLDPTSVDETTAFAVRGCELYIGE